MYDPSGPICAVLVGTIRPELLGLKRIVPPPAGFPLTVTIPLTVASVSDVSTHGLPSPQPASEKPRPKSASARRISWQKEWHSRAPSILIGRDDLAAGPRPEGPPGRDVDGRLDELDRAVAEQDVHAAGMMAVGDVGDLEIPSGSSRCWAA